VPSDAALFGRILVAALVGFGIGWERSVRGRPAGERTFGLLAIGAACFTVSGLALPNEIDKVIAGVATGVAFIGGGLVWRERSKQVHGLTTASAAWATVGLGVLCGLGELWLSVSVAVVVVLVLELFYIPGLRWLDPHRFIGRLRTDESIYGETESPD
jgi:putative Mg2+ transporter-C (MgtC) family protein